MSESEPELAAQTDDNYQQANLIVFKLDSTAKNRERPPSSRV